MASFLVGEDTWKTQLDALDDRTRREIRHKMVENGAKVLVKEMQNQIEARHHVVSGDMKKSVAPGEIKDDLDGTSISVWSQGYDRRGVSNELKSKHIINGRHSILTGDKQSKADNYLNAKFREKCEPRIFAVMNETFNRCMEELNR